MKKRAGEVRIPRDPGSRCASCVHMRPVQGYQYLLSCLELAKASPSKDHPEVFSAVFADDWCSKFAKRAE